MTKVIIEYQDKFSVWSRYTEMHHEPSVFRTAQNRAREKGGRHRLVDAYGRLLDLIKCMIEKRLIYVQSFTQIEI